MKNTPSPFNTYYQEFIYKSRYARWLPNENRREEWGETVDRYLNFLCDHAKTKHGYKVTSALKKELRLAIFNLDVMPSMRALMTAGRALEECNITAYNCAYITVDDVKALDETMYVLMCGTGVGFSVERQYVNKLPEIPEAIYDSETTIVVSDSRAGWAKGLRQLIALLYSGEAPKWDLDKLRPAGARLKTMGGRSSGPEPLDELFRFITGMFKGAVGRRLTSLECHDIMCMIGQVVVVGGVRRCLPYYSAVTTTTGIKQIKDITTDDIVVSNGMEGKVISTASTGTKSILRIKHRFGELACTPEHRVAVFSLGSDPVYVAAKDLTVGQRLVWDGAGADFVKQNLPPFIDNVHFNAKDVNVPTHISEDVAWLFGIIQGDGYVGKKEIEIYSHIDSADVLHRAQTIFEKEFNVHGKVAAPTRNREGHKECRLRVCSVALAGWFYANLKQPNTTLRIPEFIINSPRNIRGAFLAGIFESDGRVKADGGIEQLTTVYANFAEDIITVLSTLGIGSVKYKVNRQKSRDEDKKVRDAVTISVAGRTNRRNWAKYVAAYGYSTRMPDIQDNGGPYDFTVSVEEANMVLTHGAGKSVTATALGLADDGLLPSPITSITQGEEIATYDIEVEGINSFTTNGIIVHNSAMISLSNLSDDRMRHAKDGDWWDRNGQRALANNSAVYTEKPDMGTFMREWLSLYASKSGERGIFNRQASTARALVNERRNVDGVDFGTNPCSEIILQPNQFCNLSEVVIREDDTAVTLKYKVEIATILGTLQSTLTNFPYLRKIWTKNTEAERLLGVSMTGIMDNTLTNGRGNTKDLEKLLTELKEHAVAINKEYAEKIGIPQSVAVTATKPSGTVSQLVDSASGIHARYDEYYIRTVRADNKDPLTQFLKDSKIPNEPSVSAPDTTTIFSFPVKSPKIAVKRNDRTAIEQLELWLTYQRYWCEHKPSVTIDVREEEWLEVGAWVYENFDEVSGIAFFPYDGGVYKQAPYQACTEEEYNTLLAQMPASINWANLAEYELEDNTVGSQTFACSGDSCEVVDLM